MKNIKINFAILCIIILSASQVKSQDRFPPDLKVFPTQLHIHGLSNHNGSTKPGSMQWHSFYADTTNTPILWWTDHREVYTQTTTSIFNFQNGVYNAANFTITGLSGTPVIPVEWDGFNNSGQPTVALNDSSIILGMTGNTGSIYKYIYFSPRGTKGLLTGTHNFVRPVTSHPKIQFDLTPAGIDSAGKGKAQLVLLMSYHYYDGVARQQSIIYNFVNNVFPFSRELTDSSTLTVNVPVVNNSVNHLALDVASDAVLLKDGIDNTTNDYKLLVQAKQNKHITAVFSNIQIRSYDTLPYSQYLIYKGLGEGYGNRYAINEYLGAEWSGNSHLNGYLPDSTTNRENLYDDATVLLGAEYFSNKVHSDGGVVSFNHPFGSAGSLQSNTIQDYRTDTIAQFMLNNNAYGADIIEVGYMNRGGGDNLHHLKLWDILTANKLYLYGDGVSDSHGGNWYTAVNNFITWIWSQDSTPVNLIRNLKSGLFYCGNNIKFHGKFMFYADSFPMGSRTLAVHDSGYISVFMDSVLPGSQCRYTQGLLRDSIHVTYLHSNELFDPAEPPLLDLTRACFIRIVVYDSSGSPYLISNPVVFTRGSRDSIIIPDIGAITFSAPVIKCSGKNTGSITPTVTGGTEPFNYLWSNGDQNKSIANLFSGTYTVTVTDANGRTKSNSVMVTENPPLVVLATPVGSSIIGSILGGVPPYSYLWNTSPNQTTSTATGLLPGVYKLTVTDSKKCKTTTKVNLGGSRLSSESMTDYYVYPNPNNGLFKLCLSNNLTKPIVLMLASQIGTIVKTEVVSDSKNEIDLDYSNVSKGIYFLIIKQEKFTRSIKIVIQ